MGNRDWKWDFSISYYAGLLVYLSIDLRWNLGWYVFMMWFVMCRFIWHMAISWFWFGPLPYLVPRAVVTNILRWLMLMYGGLRFYWAWRKVTGSCVLSGMPHRLGDSPSLDNSRCIDTRLVRTSMYGVWDVLYCSRVCIEHLPVRARLVNLLYTWGQWHGGCMRVGSRVESVLQGAFFLLILSSHKASSLRTAMKFVTFLHVRLVFAYTCGDNLAGRMIQVGLHVFSIRAVLWFCSYRVHNRGRDVFGQYDIYVKTVF